MNFLPNEQELSKISQKIVEEIIKKNPLNPTASFLLVCQAFVSLQQMVKTDNASHSVILVILEALESQKTKLDSNPQMKLNGEELVAFANRMWLSVERTFLQRFLELLNAQEKIQKELKVPFIQELLKKQQFKQAVSLISILQLENHPEFDLDSLIMTCVKRGLLEEGQRISASKPESRKLYLKCLVESKHFKEVIRCIEDWGMTLGDLDQEIHREIMLFRTNNMKEVFWEKIEANFVDFEQRVLLVTFIENLLGKPGFESFLGVQKMLSPSIGLSVMQRRNVGVGELRDPIARANAEKALMGKWEFIPNALIELDYFGPLQLIRQDNDPSKPALANRDYLKLEDIGIDQKDILFEDKADESCFEEILQSKYVALDMEYTPKDLLSNQKGVALFQMSTGKKVFLFDVMKLGPTKKFADFLEALMSSEKIVKLNHSFGGDLEVLRNSVELKMDLDQRTKNIVDLAQVFDIVKTSATNSLAAMTSELLKKDLCKVILRPSEK